jgi:N-acyl-D-amino-acid deacylase
LRSEGARLVEALAEAIEISKTGGCRLHVSHLKTSGRDNWGKLDKALELIAKAQSEGLCVSADRYPYIYSKTNLSVVLPPPFSDMDDASIETALRDEAAFTSLEHGLRSSTRDWNMVLLASSKASFAKELCGLSMADAAAKLSLSVSQLVAKLMREDATGAEAAFGGMSQFNLERILALPWLACGSDESARPLDFSIGRSHPRGFGSFPRFLNMVAGRFGMPEAVRRATSLPAELFKLQGRGAIAKGFHADLTLFDERKLKDEASFNSPHKPASGIEAVYVAGRLSFSPANGSCGRAGAALRI